MEKLVDSSQDVLVYAGTERHLGINYQIKVSRYMAEENRLGAVLMKIRQEQVSNEHSNIDNVCVYDLHFT